MTRLSRIAASAIAIAGGIALAGVIASGAAAAATGEASEIDTPITGAALARASEAALAHIGSGSVTDTEVGDEESYYEVEITLDDGGEVDVQLDESFAVVGSEGGK